MSVGDREYFEAFGFTRELIARLEGFVAGRETNESLEKWARGVWGGTQAGPVRSNRPASAVLTNLWNATARTSSRDESSPFLLRAIDAAEYLRRLQRGTMGRRARRIGGLSAPLQTFAAQLGLETERYVLSGLGWYEALPFASPGTGRAFSLTRGLEHLEELGGPSTDILTDAEGDVSDVLLDVLETLCLDLDDLSWFKPVLGALWLPRWALWRQDDNGHRIAIAMFSGRRKAEAALRHYESLPHKQTYWLERDGFATHEPRSGPAA